MNFMEALTKEFGSLGIPIIAVLGLIVIAAIVGIIVSICLAISYAKYNKKEASCGLTGEQVARKILDDNGLSNIKVTASGSFLLGNSYSHMFKKVRLRRAIWQKKSVTSLGMAAQKSSLAVMDKENDSDMRSRVRIDFFTNFGPLAFIPMILIGILMDGLILKTFANGSTPWIFLICCVLSIVFYVLSFFLAFATLKTEKKAQNRAYAILQAGGMATAEELEMLKKLFKLYNIEYINNLIIAFLEVILRILLAIAKSKSGSSKS